MVVTDYSRPRSVVRFPLRIGVSNGFRCCGTLRLLSKRYQSSDLLPPTGPSAPAPLTEVAEKVDAPKILGHSIVTEECLSSIVGDRAYYELPILHISAKRNNIFATLSDCNGRILTRSSCSSEGFHNARKKTTVAAQTLGISIGLKAQKLGISSVRVKMRGLGANRISTLSGANLSGLQLVSLTDDTSVHYGHGKRPRKLPRK
ncbi:unnamed protein product [Calicophoron daubneyi]|uniref:Ribosomal protein S11 n=1 Tax=Calicophoron daubneyi TaxID=300641 RepID=A0AAV2TGF9_CALDB